MKVFKPTPSPNSQRFNRTPRKRTITANSVYECRKRLETQPQRYISVDYYGLTPRSVQLQKLIAKSLENCDYTCFTTPRRIVAKPPYQLDTSQLFNTTKDDSSCLCCTHTDDDCQCALNVRLAVNGQEPHTPCADSNKVVYFIHGCGGSTSVWYNCFDADLWELKGYEIVLIDLLGHGYSSKPHERHSYDFEEIMSDVFAIFDATCKLDNIIVAHSQGAMYASCLARARSQLVSKLAVISAGDATDTSFRHLEPSDVPRHIFKVMFPLMRRMFMKVMYWNEVENAADYMAIDGGTMWNYMKGNIWARRHGRQYRFFDFGQLLPHNSNLKVLVVHARNDRFMPWSRKMQSRYDHPNVKVKLFADCGHMIPVEKPELLRNTLEAFLSIQ